MGREIGLVEYVIDANDTMAADWYMRVDGQFQAGSGKVVGDNDGQFAGEYEVTYFNLQNERIATFDLSIQHNNDGFELIWRTAGEIKFEGIGRVEGDTLIAAYTSP